MSAHPCPRSVGYRHNLRRALQAEARSTVFDCAKMLVHLENILPPESTTSSMLAAIIQGGSAPQPQIETGTKQLWMLVANTQSTYRSLVQLMRSLFGSLAFASSKSSEGKKRRGQDGNWVGPHHGRYVIRDPPIVDEKAPRWRSAYMSGIPARNGP